MSNISFHQFANEIAKDLEIEGTDFQTASLRNVPEYDSMGRITVSLTIERLFGFQIAYEVLDNTDTLHNLYQLCCAKAQQ